MLINLLSMTGYSNSCALDKRRHGVCCPIVSESQEYTIIHSFWSWCTLDFVQMDPAPNEKPDIHRYFLFKDSHGRMESYESVMENEREEVFHS